MEDWTESVKVSPAGSLPKKVINGQEMEVAVSRSHTPAPCPCFQSGGGEESAGIPLSPTYKNVEAVLLMKQLPHGFSSL